MCGIYGIISKASMAGEERIATHMRDSISHRGPDHVGRFMEPGVLLGINRLAIIDVDGGNQPISNEDGSLVIVYNGEIYNHVELRRELEARGHIFRSHTDTETVLHAFEEYGVNCLDRFNGMFALAIWDRRARKLFLARDRLGIKPLYIAELDDGRLAFASEAKSLLGLIPGGPRPDFSALSRYLSFGYVPTPESPFENIRKFSPGHYAWFVSERLTTHRYWAPSYGDDNEIDFKQAVDQLHVLLDQAIQAELMSDVDLGVFLSGGMDSSAVAAFAQRHCPDRLKSFALRFTERTHDESADARRVAEHLGLEHHECVFTESDLQTLIHEAAGILDEPFGDSTILPLLALSRYARQHVKVVLTGWGGDELFAGYPTYKAHQWARTYRRAPRPVAEYLIPAVVQRLPVSNRYMSLEFKAKRFIKGMNLPPELQHFVWMGYFDDGGKRRLLTDDVLHQINGESYDPVIDCIWELQERHNIDRIMHLDARFFLEGNGLFQADRMTMAGSLEARVPLLNHSLFSFVSQLPAALKMKDGKLKELLRTTLKPYLPQQILNKPKKGFGPPSAAWIRGPLAKTVNDVLCRDKIEAQGVFRHKEISRLIDEHRNRRADHGRNLWSVLSMQLWLDHWIGNNHTVSQMAEHVKQKSHSTGAAAIREKEALLA